MITAVIIPIVTQLLPAAILRHLIIAAVLRHHRGVAAAVVAVAVEADPAGHRDNGGIIN